MVAKRGLAVRFVKKYALLFFGSVVAATGLEFFLIPNQIIDGGIVGVSILLSHTTGIDISLLLVLLNLPFLYVGYKQIGKSFCISTLFSVVSLSYWVYIFHPIPELTKDFFLAATFGGVLVGVGVGLIIRNGGSLDGTEIVAIILDKKSGFSVGEIIMFFNVFILGSAGLVFGWDKAMYSLVAYFVAFKVIDITIEGLDESKGVMIVSDCADEIREVLLARLGRGVTVLHGEGGYSQEPKKVLYSVVTRLEIAKLKSIIDDVDPDAFVTIQDVHDVIGGRVKKKAIH
ncbi:YitT family protein [Anaeroselena agilis]|uniref:YitT family protein n=1 Tax=Anaeroselena agilis TaxID=3063788 RepID=A0ABU3NZ01_9FIRM|nr:YitT family protein [Selenomonadales bacterium 4137-cl]